MPVVLLSQPNDASNGIETSAVAEAAVVRGLLMCQGGREGGREGGNRKTTNQPTQLLDWQHRHVVWSFGRFEFDSACRSGGPRHHFAGRAGWGSGQQSFLLERVGVFRLGKAVRQVRTLLSQTDRTGRTGPDGHGGGARCHCLGKSLKSNPATSFTPDTIDWVAIVGLCCWSREGLQMPTMYHRETVTVYNCVLFYNL